jgi:hypothetical protein
MVSVGSSVEWRAQFLPNGQGTIIVKTIVSTLFKAGLDNLKSRFGGDRWRNSKTQQGALQWDRWKKRSDLVVLGEGVS